jgi:hypothetical protein
VKSMAGWDEKHLEGLEELVKTFDLRDQPEKAGQFLAAWVASQGLTPPAPSAYTGPH